MVQFREGYFRSADHGRIAMLTNSKFTYLLWQCTRELHSFVGGDRDAD